LLISQSNIGRRRVICYNCGATLNHPKFCTNCGADVVRYKKIVSSANLLYNEGLEKASVRDLSGAISCLRQCIRLDKNNVDAHNLLGLIYFEIGEHVSAYNEWVISVNLRETKNIAKDYINMVQNDQGKLEAYNQACKKYNQALSYCYHGDLDLAKIQLKKVLSSLNPRYVQARQLLALLYLNDEEWEKAKEELLKCQKIDVNNTITLRYLKEANTVLEIDNDGNEGRVKGLRFESKRNKREKENEIYTPPVRRESSALATIVNVIIGIAIGISVAYLLILPARISAAKDGMDESLKAVNEQLDAKTAEISGLEQKIKTAQNQNEKLTEELEIYTGDHGQVTAMDNLLEAVGLYLDSPESSTEIAESLDKISQSSLDGASDSFVAVYNNLLSKVGETVGAEYYDSGIKAYQNETFEEAIADLTKAYSYDNSNGDALYNLGNAYRKSGDIINAIDTYQKVIEEFPDTEMATRSQQYINELNVD